MKQFNRIHIIPFISTMTDVQIIIQPIPDTLYFILNFNNCSMMIPPLKYSPFVINVSPVNVFQLSKMSGRFRLWRCIKSAIRFINNHLTRGSNSSSFILLKSTASFELASNTKWLMCGSSRFNNGRCLSVA